MKGIILAGGTGSRLFPSTKVISKQLMPVFDKPLIYYPLSTLLMSNIKDILIITTRQDIDNFKRLFGDGAQLGIHLSYKIQENPAGLPDAFIIGEEFIGNDSVCMILGDNILYGHGLPEIFQEIQRDFKGCTVLGYHVNEPERYGIVKFDENDNIIELVEKPKQFISNWALIGVYYFDSRVSNFAKQLKPSSRGETEITELMKKYLEMNELSIKKLGRGTAWLDAGSHASLTEASVFVEIVEKRQGLKIGCIEEIAYNFGFINRDQLLELAKPLEASGYGKYLNKVANEGKWDLLYLKQH